MSQFLDTNRIIYKGREYPYITFTAQDILDYQGLRDMYHGIGGFKDGSYLIPFPRESTGGTITVNDETVQLPNFFQMRKDLAHYENAFASELDASVDPIYSKEQIRDVSGSQVVENFVMRPTGQNFTMSEYKRRHQLETKLFGTTWEVLDAPKEVPANASVETEQRFSPYAQFLTPLQIEGYSLDKRGGLQMLVYFEDINERNNLTGTRVTFEANDFVLRIWLKAEIDILDAEGFPTGETNIEFVTFKYFQDAVMMDSVKTFDSLPVMMWEDNSREQPNIIARSKHLFAVSIEKKRYNLESQVNDSYVKNCFAFLAVNQDVQESIDLGNDSVFQYPGENVNIPAYVAPPVAHLDSINAKISQLRTDLKEDMNSTIVLDSRASGDARMASDKRRLEKLKQDTKDVQDAETWLVNVALRNYVSGNWTFAVKYIADFESLTKIDSLETIDNIIDSQGSTEELKRELVVDKITIVYGNDEVRMKELINLQRTGTIESSDTLPNDSFNDEDTSEEGSGHEEDDEEDNEEDDS